MDRLKIRQSKSGSMYTSDIDPGVTAVLIAKYAVLQAYQTRYHVNDMRDRAKEVCTYVSLYSCIRLSNSSFN